MGCRWNWVVHFHDLCTPTLGDDKLQYFRHYVLLKPSSVQNGTMDFQSVPVPPLSFEERGLAGYSRPFWTVFLLFTRTRTGPMLISSIWLRWCRNDSSHQVRQDLGQKLLCLDVLRMANVFDKLCYIQSCVRFVKHALSRACGQQLSHRCHLATWPRAFQISHPANCSIICTKENVLAIQVSVESLYYC